MAKLLSKEISIGAENETLPYDINFRDLFNVDDIQKIQDGFALSTGIASLITDPDGVPITEASNFCQLCKIIRKTEKGLKNCHKSDAAIGKLNPGGPIMQPCLSGELWDGGASISVGGKHIGNWLVGQIRNETQSDEKMMDYAREIGADEKDFKKALSEVKTMSTEQFQQTCNTLFLFANQLSQTAYQNFIQKKIIAERDQMSLDLKNTKNYLDNIINSMPSSLISVDSNGIITQINIAAGIFLGINPKDAENRSISNFSSQLFVSQETISDSIKSRKAKSFTHHSDAKEIVQRHEKITIFPLITNGVKGATIRIDDISKEHKLEEQLYHSRKMDAIGQLAGGVAHDFNNMLGGILGAADLLKGRMPDLDNENHTLLELIIDASNRAADLTSKLLAFGRKGKQFSKPEDINAIITNSVDILQRTVDKKININIKYSAQNSTVNCDGTSLMNSFLNIGINASHAMPDGGDIIIETENIQLDKIFCTTSPFDLTPGTYIRVEIRDMGCGIPLENLKKIWEPFYTTKEVGKGTGLGLAAVYGTIEAHNGAVTAYSEVGKGTSFHILLPCVKETISNDYVDSKVYSGTGCILLADDEEFIRITGEYMLKDMGYEVLTAENGLEAIEVFSKNRDKIDLVILDMIMPEMDGSQAFKSIRKLKENAKVIIASGFTKDESLSDLRDAGLSGFIRKPYRESELSQLVSEVILKSADA
jgi:PAS domain S-box-containing protein